MRVLLSEESACLETLGHHESGMVAQSCNPSTQEAEVELELQGHPWLHRGV